MPEIAEVARIVHYVRKHLVGHTLAKVVAVDDTSVYGKVGTSGAAFQKALNGRKVIGAGQQGKYFWMVMDQPPHPLMHFGMNGWLKIKNEQTYYYRKKKEDEAEEWPPRFWKFHLTTADEPVVEAAFVDSRRFARVRLLACAADDIRNVTPLMENGPDPVIDKDLVTVEWLTELCRRKKIPIKALLLDQANISGIGNWVGDEIMYHAKIHPEQYSNTLSDLQIKGLHKSTHYVCSTAVNLLADSEKFPSNWLFKHRWGKGKKDSPKQLPSGEKITFLTVGGRTSAIVPSAQSKTGPVAKDISEAADGVEEIDGPSKMSGAKTSKKRKTMADSQLPDIDDDVKDDKSAKRQRKSKFKEELSEADQPLGMESNGKSQTSEIGKQRKSVAKAAKSRRK
jgi:formamidopyrimidine-DNA glycosylase